MKYSESEIKRIYEKINENSVELKNGCIDWNGKRDGENPIIFTHNRVYITKFLWEQQYPDDPRLPNEDFTRTCDLKYCLNFDHIQKKSKQNYISKEDKPRIWKRLLERSEREGGCLIWKGLFSGDYGRISLYRKVYSVHKVSFWIYNDYNDPHDIPLEDGDYNRLVIRHLCGNHKCIEPQHLQLGTCVENSSDMIEHGTRLFGELHPGCKITEEIAIQIKESKYDKSDPRYISMKERANLFNISASLISAIDNGRAWSHISETKRIEINKTKERQSELRKKSSKKAKSREWTNEMWQQASEKLSQRTVILDLITSEHVDTPCHEWTGPVSPQGYGSIGVFGRQLSSHILACEIKNKEKRPSNLVTRHLCGNKICCNPDHLEWGTHSENSIDVTRHGTRKTIVNEEIVKEIRETKGS